MKAIINAKRIRMDSMYLASFNKTYDLELLDRRWQISLIALYSATAIFSLLANIFAVIILLSINRSTSEIWKYLINLSVSDILMSMFSIPFTYTSFMLGQWIFPLWLCPIVQSVQLCSVLVSIYTLALIGFDRYFAIIHPIYSLIYLKRHKIRLITLIWILSILFATIQWSKTEAMPFVWNDQTLHDCREVWNENEGKLYTVFIFILTFAFPVLMLIFVYISIGLHIIQRRIPGNTVIHRDALQWNIKIKVIKMLIIIVMAFILCWLPIHIHTLIVWFYPLKLTTYSRYMAYVVSFFCCHWLAMAHSFLNPFIYGLFIDTNQIELIVTVLFRCETIVNRINQSKISIRRMFLRKRFHMNRGKNCQSITELEKFSNQQTRTIRLDSGISFNRMLTSTNNNDNILN
ncbi:Neuromedin-K receptor [Sarcoptes scabiei]|uniref:Neuropeptide Y receptor n=1 Tax=Sarcoptes scabiei TaxID=52283 RepID=A0A834VCS1_SARSC|nr:Neuromedin-K receptor [Sarcoptes scabiei]